MRTITPEELNTLEESGRILLDLRTESAFAEDHIPGAIRMDRDVILAFASADELPSEFRGRRIVLYCQFGILSKEAAEHLEELGLDAAHLEGGYGKWLAKQMLQKADDEERRKEIEAGLRKTFRKDLTSRFAKALNTYELLSPGDHVAVCISGGKDSMLMAKLFQEIKRHNKIPFDLTFLCMDPGDSESTLGMIRANAELLGIPLVIFSSPIFDTVDHVDQSPCYLCARMRRGYLYDQAKKRGCNKIALGHHYDDVIETTLMSILYSGQTQTMMPKLHSMHFEGMELIRPMYMIREKDIIRWRDANRLQFIRCACHFTDTCSTEGKGDADSKRMEARRLIRQLTETNDNVEENIFRSMENIHLDAVLGYKSKGIKHSFLDDYDA